MTKPASSPGPGGDAGGHHKLGVPGVKAPRERES
jgi:hypothetical protein